MYKPTTDAGRKMAAHFVALGKLPDDLLTVGDLLALVDQTEAPAAAPSPASAGAR